MRCTGDLAVDMQGLPCACPREHGTSNAHPCFATFAGPGYKRKGLAFGKATGIMPGPLSKANSNAPWKHEPPMRYPKSRNRPRHERAHCVDHRVSKQGQNISCSKRERCFHADVACNAPTVLGRSLWRDRWLRHMQSGANLGQTRARLLGCGCNQRRPRKRPTHLKLAENGHAPVVPLCRKPVETRVGETKGAIQLCIDASSPCTPDGKCVAQEGDAIKTPPATPSNPEFRGYSVKPVRLCMHRWAHESKPAL